MSTLLTPLARPNALIASLPRAARELVAGACGPAELFSGDIVTNPGEKIRRVYFPTSSFISLITPAGASESVEVGMVGHEGVFGITLLLDVKTSPLLALVQGAGHALEMSASRFVQLAGEIAPFRKVLNRYLYVLTAEVAQTAACNRFHSLDARLARWLLMTRDRATSDTFHLTHKFLAYMLGVRRAGITEAASRLQKKKLIHYHHGQLTVLDRRGLEEISCACYAAVNSTYARHLEKPRVAIPKPTTRRVF